jgi:hypothetical protein
VRGHPATIRKYADDMAELKRLAREGVSVAGSELALSLREIISSVAVHYDPVSSKGVRVQVFGVFHVFTQAPQARRVGGLVVAREGLEPPTRGL